MSETCKKLMTSMVFKRFQWSYVMQGSNAQKHFEKWFVVKLYWPKFLDGDWFM
jgi:hypothetical protein